VPGIEIRTSWLAGRKLFFIRKTKSMRVRWLRHTAGIGARRNAYRVFIKKRKDERKL
jgi:hypothetical protein